MGEPTYSEALAVARWQRTLEKAGWRVVLAEPFAPGAGDTERPAPRPVGGR